MVAETSLKYEDVADVGDVIRSYDFSHRDDCYIEGVVLRKGDVHPEFRGLKVFEFRCTKAIREGLSDERPAGIIYYAPFETFFDYDGRIKNLTVKESV